MEAVLVAAIGGFALGIATWFPFKYVTKRLLLRKRKASAILNELGMNEQEHAKFDAANFSWSAPVYTTTYDQPSPKPSNTTGGNWQTPKRWTNTYDDNTIRWRG